MRLEDMHCKHCDRTPLQVNFIQKGACTTCWRGKRKYGENHVVKFYNNPDHDASVNTCECGEFKTIAAKRCADCNNRKRRKPAEDSTAPVSLVPVGPGMSPMNQFLPPRKRGGRKVSVQQMREDTLKYLRAHCPNAYGRPDAGVLAPSVVGWPDADG